MADSYFLGILIGGDNYDALSLTEQEQNRIQANTRFFELLNWWMVGGSNVRPSFTPNNLNVSLLDLIDNVNNIVTTNVDVFNIDQATESSRLISSSDMVDLYTPYNSSILYEVGDTVSYNDNNYVCVYPICTIANNQTPGTTNDPQQWQLVSRYRWEQTEYQLSDNLNPGSGNSHSLIITGNSDGTATISTMAISGALELPTVTSGNAGRIVKINADSNNYDLNDVIADNVIVFGAGTGGLKGSAIVWDSSNLPANDTTRAIQITTNSSGVRTITYNSALPSPSSASANRLIGVNNTGDGFEFKAAIDTLGGAEDVNKIAYVSAYDTANNYGTISFDTADNLGLVSSSSGGGSGTPTFYGYRDQDNQFRITKFTRGENETAGSFDINTYEGYCVEYSDISFSRSTTDGRVLRGNYTDFTLDLGKIGINPHGNYSTWNSTDSYVVDDRRLHNGKLWESLSSNSNSEPSVSSTDWEQVLFNCGDVVFHTGTSYISDIDNNSSEIGSGAINGWHTYLEGAGATAISDLTATHPVGSHITTDSSGTAQVLPKSNITGQLLTADSTADLGQAFRTPSGTNDHHQVDETIQPFAFMQFNYIYLKSGKFLNVETRRTMPSGCIEGAATDDDGNAIANRFKEILSFKSGSRHAVLALDYNGVVYLCENGAVGGRYNGTNTGASIDAFSHGVDDRQGSVSLDLRPISWFIDQSITIKDIHMSYYNYYGTGTENTSVFYSGQDNYPGNRLSTFGVCYFFITSDNKLYRLARGDIGLIYGGNALNRRGTETTPVLTAYNGSTDALSATKFLGDKDHLGIDTYFQTAETTGSAYRKIGYSQPNAYINIGTVTNLPNIEDDPVVKFISATKYRNLRAIFSSTFNIIADGNDLCLHNTHLSIALTESGNVYWGGIFPLTGNTITYNTDGYHRYTTTVSPSIQMSSATHFDGRSIKDVKIGTYGAFPTVMFLTTDGYLYTTGRGTYNFTSGQGFTPSLMPNTDIGRLSIHSAGNSNYAYSAPALAIITDRNGNDMQGNVDSIDIDTFLGLWAFIGAGRRALNSIQAPVATAILKMSNGDIYMPVDSNPLAVGSRDLSHIGFYASNYSVMPALTSTTLEGYKKVQGLQNKDVVKIAYAAPFVPLVIYDDGTASIGNAYSDTPNASATNTDYIAYYQTTNERYSMGQVRNDHDSSSTTVPDLFDRAVGEPAIFKFRKLRIT